MLQTDNLHCDLLRQKTQARRAEKLIDEENFSGFLNGLLMASQKSIEGFYTYLAWSYRDDKRNNLMPPQKSVVKRWFRPRSAGGRIPEQPDVIEIFANYIRLPHEEKQSLMAIWEKKSKARRKRTPASAIRHKPEFAKCA